MSKRTCIGEYDPDYMTDDGKYPCRACSIRAICMALKGQKPPIDAVIELLRGVNPLDEAHAEVIEAMISDLEDLLRSGSPQDSKPKLQYSVIDSPKLAGKRAINDYVYYDSVNMSLPDEHEVERVTRIAQALGKPLIIKKYKNNRGNTVYVYSQDKQIQMYLRENGTIKVLKKGYTRRTPNAWLEVSDEEFITKFARDFKNETHSN